MQRWDELALELTNYGFLPAYFLNLYCSDHGSIRCAVAYQPDCNSHPCPVCGKPCNAGYLGRAYTRRSLPFFDVLFAPPSWTGAADKEEQKQPDLPAEIVKVLADGASYPAVAQQFGISEKRALRIRKQAGLPARLAYEHH